MIRSRHSDLISQELPESPVPNGKGTTAGTTPLDVNTSPAVNGSAAAGAAATDNADPDATDSSKTNGTDIPISGIGKFNDKDKPSGRNSPNTGRRGGRGGKGG